MIKQLIKKYAEFLRYLIVGFSVTFFTLGLIYVLDKFVIKGNYPLANAVGGAISILAAFFPYKLFVFRSKSFSPKVMVREFLGFVSARIFTYLFDVAFVWLFVWALKFNHVYSVDIVRYATEMIGKEAVIIKESAAPFISFNLKEEWIIKLLSMVITTIANYIFSKFVIFKKSKVRENEITESI